MIPNWKKGITDLQQYHWKLSLINNVEDIVVSLPENAFNFDNGYIMAFVDRSHSWKKSVFKIMKMDL